MDGDGDLEGTLDRDPLSETVSLERLREPPDLLLHFSSDEPLFRLNIESMKLSLFAFFFTSLEEDFPHHEGMLM